MTNIEAAERGLVRYDDLSDKAKKVAYDHIAISHLSNDKIMSLLDRHWFTADGGLYVGSL